MPLTATTLTLPSHKQQAQHASSHDGLERMLEIACEGLSLTPEQLRQELEENGDIRDLVSGELTPAALRSTAETLSTMRYAGDALKSNTPAEARHQAVLCMLANKLGVTYVLTNDTEGEPHTVIVMLAIRDKGACELRIPKGKYDGLALLQVIEEHTAPTAYITRGKYDHQ